MSLKSHIHSRMDSSLTYCLLILMRVASWLPGGCHSSRHHGCIQRQEGEGDDGGARPLSEIILLFSSLITEEIFSGVSQPIVTSVSLARMGHMATPSCKVSCETRYTAKEDRGASLA